MMSRRVEERRSSPGKAHLGVVETLLDGSTSSEGLSSNETDSNEHECEEDPRRARRDQQLYHPAKGDK